MIKWKVVCRLVKSSYELKQVSKNEMQDLMNSRNFKNIHKNWNIHLYKKIETLSFLLFQYLT